MLLKGVSHVPRVGSTVLFNRRRGDRTAAQTAPLLLAGSLEAQLWWVFRLPVCLQEE